MKRFIAATTFALAIGLAATTPAAAAGQPDPVPLVISLQEIDCQSCGAAVAELLQRQDGVEDATFDRDAVEVTVHRGDGAPSTEDLFKLVQTAGYKGVVGSGEGRYLPSVEFADGLDVDWISRAGEAVDIDEQLVSGKVTVVDFYAVWCGPCREVDKVMEEILAQADDVALRKINVVDWFSPIAKQELAGVTGLPYVEVYGKDGKRRAAIAGLDLGRLRKVIDKARRQ